MQNQIAKSIHEDRQIFNALANAVPAAISILRNQRLLYVNTAWENLTGYCQNESLTMDHRLFIHPEMRDEVFKRAEDRLNGKNVPERYEVKILTKGGQVKWADLSVRVIPYEGSPAILTVALDITQRKQQEEELKKYKELISQINDLVFVCDDQRNLIYANRVFEKFTSEKLDDCIGESFSDLFDDENLKTAMKAYYKTLNGENTQFQLQFKKTNIICEFKNIPLRNQNQKVIGVMGVARDITKRKQVEMALKESEERLNSFYHATFEGIMITEQGKIIDVNHQFAKIVGYERNELIGKEVINLVVEEDREIVLGNIQSDFDHPYEGRAKKKDGSIIFVEAHGHQIMYQGRPSRVTAIHNITERKQAEEALADSKRRLAEIIEFLPDPTWVIDKDGRVLAWNRAVERLTGVKKKDILGKGDYAHSIPFYGEPRPTLANLVLHRDEKWEKKYMTLKEKNGVPIAGVSFNPSMGEDGLYLSATAARLYDSKGHVAGAIQSVRDITIAKQSEQERENLIQELQDALKKVRTLSGLLPICAKCKKIRDDNGYWNQIELYIHEHSKAEFSHGLCPDCSDELYGDQGWYKKMKKENKKN
jgi:PAS domain S-box-containing protein